MSLNLYLDSCILIAYYYEFDAGDNHQKVINCLEFLKNSNKKINIVTSDFTFTEFVKVLQLKDKIGEDKIFKYLSNLTRQKKIGNKYPFNLIEPEGYDKNYTFNDFFVGLQEILLNARPGLADAIHAQIMINNKTRHILTFDTKDFGKISEIRPIHPDELDQFISKILIPK